MKKDYYIYIHYRKSNPLEPFYVGKGRKERAWKKRSRNPHWEAIVNKDRGFRCEIVYRGLSETEAYEKEISLVALYGRRDLGTGCLVNMTDGGDGPSNPSEETRKKIAEIHRGNQYAKGKQYMKGKIMSEEARKKISESKMGTKNPNYGKSLSEETRRKNSEAIRKYWANKRLNGGN